MVEAVLFDWDGTLFDVFDFLVDTYTKVFSEIGVEPWPQEKYRTEFRCDWKSLLIDMGMEQHLDHLIDVWNTEKYEKENELKLHDGAFECVKKLSADKTLGIVSSAPKEILRSEVKRFGLDKYMDLVLSFEDTENNKPHPEPLLTAAKILDLDTSKTVYVGDMVEDIQSAKSAGVRPIAVSWGIHSPKTLEKEKPDYIAKTFQDLLEYIETLD
ncbi:MAG TPA: HAD family hydrolase [Candidatus Altiarchaeales archaeon]|nr:HAD family hydrolase [Candidatus Altiarchaeales archaeon]